MLLLQDHSKIFKKYGKFHNLSVVHDFLFLFHLSALSDIELWLQIILYSSWKIRYQKCKTKYIFSTRMSMAYVTYACIITKKIIYKTDGTEALISKDILIYYWRNYVSAMIINRQLRHFPKTDGRRKNWEIRQPWTKHPCWYRCCWKHIQYFPVPISTQKGFRSGL